MARAAVGRADKSDVNYCWQKASAILERELPTPMFASWVRPIKPLTIENDSFILVAPEEATKQTLEHRYLPLISQIIRVVTERDLNVRVILPGDINERGEIARPRQTERMLGSSLNPRYVFDSFVEGKSNQMAFAASRAVAEAPGRTRYNPLFLYGGVGLGKTHLMQSIGNSILHGDPESKVLYTTSENLMNEFITSLRERKNQEFRDKYRMVDVLLVDDIQFLTEKEGTQEEFFHTFEALYNNSKQIVISSDKPPVELKTLEERLTSRFGMGLIVDITLPDFETRTAILEKKAELDRLDIPVDVLRHIARHVSSNIREMEGALIKVSAYGKLTNTTITIDLAERALRDMISGGEKREVTCDLIMKIVGNELGVRPDEMRAKKRTQNITYARHLAMYMCRMLLDIPLNQIGRAFGGRDHTTVIHAYNKINDELEVNPGLRGTIAELENMITGE
ncbi:MAG: chromosomal replication initiator protein DnaA [Clostridiales bacterium]|nr:chromosomal replication initiator protein DnaA [Clostridiales bacterium]